MTNKVIICGRRNGKSRLQTIIYFWARLEEFGVCVNDDGSLSFDRELTPEEFGHVQYLYSAIKDLSDK